MLLLVLPLLLMLNIFYVERLCRNALNYAVNFVYKIRTLAWRERGTPLRLQTNSIHAPRMSGRTPSTKRGRTSSTTPGSVDGPRPHPKGCGRSPSTLEGVRPGVRGGRPRPLGCGRSPSTPPGAWTGSVHTPGGVDGPRPRRPGTWTDSFHALVPLPVAWTDPVHACEGGPGSGSWATERASGASAGPRPSEILRTDSVLRASIRSISVDG